VSASLTPLNQRAQTQNSFGDFAERLKSGVLNEKNNFNCAGGLAHGICFRAGTDARREFIASTGSFK
jgi:hypothetical protein